MTEQMTLRGTLKGHNGWVTQIATTPQYPDMILSASRGEVSPAGFANMANITQLSVLVFCIKLVAIVNESFD